MHWSWHSFYARVRPRLNTLIRMMLTSISRAISHWATRSLPGYHIKGFELTWNVLQYPPAPLKVGTPLSALTPAPDNTTICLALESTCLNSAMSDDCRAPSNFAIVWYRPYYMDNGTHDRTHKETLHSCLLFSDYLQALQADLRLFLVTNKRTHWDCY